MTTGEGEAGPAERTNDKAETAPGSGLSSRARTGGDAEEPAPLSGNVTAPPKDVRQLEREIERTREQLGETVQELVARVDVKSRALAKASEVVAGTTAAARQKAASAGQAHNELVPLTAVAVAIIIDCLAIWQWRRPSSAAR